MAKCELCGEEFPGLDNHHLVPICYGGKEDGATIAICASDHDTLHRLGEDESISIENVPNYLKTVVAVVKEAKRRYLNGETEARDKRNKIMLVLEPEEREMMLWLKDRLNSSSQINTLRTCLRIVFDIESRK